MRGSCVVKAGWAGWWGLIQLSLNGVAERWMRTLKEECIYLHDFESLEHAREVIGAFVRRYNEEWLLERHGYMTPTEARLHLTKAAA